MKQSGVMKGQYAEKEKQNIREGELSEVKKRGGRGEAVHTKGGGKNKKRRALRLSGWEKLRRSKKAEASKGKGNKRERSV